jgi:hypothetical protein
MTLRERIREFRRQAVLEAAPGLKGTHERANRQEWAESRKRCGWTPSLVDQAIGAGPLAAVREAIRENIGHVSPRLAVAMKALGTIDSGRSVEPQSPHYGLDTTPLQRRTYAPVRIRAV